MDARTSRLALAGTLLALGSCRSTRDTSLPSLDAAGSRVTVSWDTARRSIASATECPLYSGMHVAPQDGLTPWRRNPASGLWEFLVDETGTVPAVNAYGSIESTAEDAIVLVLIPADDASRSNGKPQEDERTPPTRPYFLATHELSIRQARALTGLESPESDPEARNPYVYVTWSEAGAILGWRGLRLPTESEWRFADTAFEGMTWWTKTSIQEQCSYVRGNIADHELRSTYSLYVDMQHQVFDGFALVAPCGTFGPSAAGLYDMTGNVEEWIDDETGRVDRSSVSDDHARRITKGGSFLSLIENCRPESRALHPADERNGTIGLRAARSLDGPKIRRYF